MCFLSGILFVALKWNMIIIHNTVENVFAEKHTHIFHTFFLIFTHTKDYLHCEIMSELKIENPLKFHGPSPLTITHYLPLPPQLT